MKPTRVVALAIVVTSAVVVRTIIACRRARIVWWTAQGQLALPALHPADRSLVRIAEELIRSA